MIPVNDCMDRLHSRLISHFTMHLPNACRCIELDLNLSSVDVLIAAHNFLSVDWDEIGQALQRLPLLDSVVIRLGKLRGGSVPLWSSNTINYVHRALEHFNACRGASELDVCYRKLRVSCSRSLHTRSGVFPLTR